MCLDCKCIFLTTDQKLGTLTTHEVIKGILTQKSHFSLLLKSTLVLELS